MRTLVFLILVTWSMSGNAETAEKTLSSTEQESQIPVKLAQKTEAAQTNSSSASLFFGLGAVILVAGAGTWFLKKYSFKNRESTKNSIKVLTQYHLGPKKSLAIVQVAGDTVLIGVTDHHIGLIKSLSLLDDEVPELEGKDFQTVATENELGVDPKDDFKMTGLHQIGRGLR